MVRIALPTAAEVVSVGGGVWTPGGPATDIARPMLGLPTGLVPPAPLVAAIAAAVPTFKFAGGAGAPPVQYRHVRVSGSMVLDGTHYYGGGYDNWLGQSKYVALPALPAIAGLHPVMFNYITGAAEGALLAVNDAGYHSFGQAWFSFANRFPFVGGIAGQINADNGIGANPAALALVNDFVYEDAAFARADAAMAPRFWRGEIGNHAGGGSDWVAALTQSAILPAPAPAYGFVMEVVLPASADTLIGEASGVFDWWGAFGYYS